MSEESEPLALNTTAVAPPPKARKRPAKAEEDAEAGNVENNNSAVKKKTKISEDENKVFISSLFNHNPEIPKVHDDGEDAAAVEPVKEAVFASKAYSDPSVGLHPYLVSNLANHKITEMTSVQAAALPVVLAGKDALIKSQTGSGKTLAYALPLINKLQEIRPKISRSDGIFAIVVVPTRELAIQSYEWFEKLCKTFMWIVPGTLLGGENKKSEKARVRKGINILISTPGRLIDHIEHTKCLSLKKCEFLILDEADRMLELGYERDVQKIITAIDEQRSATNGEGEEEEEPENVNTSSGGRQTLLLSATLTKGIEQLSEISMKHPVLIDVVTSSSTDPSSGSNGKSNEEILESMKTLTTPENLQQTYAIVPAKLRLVTLASFVLWKCRFTKPRKILVFCSTQDMVDFHLELFERCLNRLQDENDIEDNSEDDLEITEDAKAMMPEKAKNILKKKEQKWSSKKKIELLKLHGSMAQKDRTQVFKKFRDAISGVLFCTDVAARGLDLPQVDWIVQYNPPISKADYVHRVGRTARIGAKGSSLLFLLPSEAKFVKSLEEERLPLAEMTLEQVLQKLYKNAEPSPRTGRPPHSMEEAATDLQMSMENAVSADEELHGKASQAYVSFVRSYASYPKDIRDVFCFKELHLGHIAKSYALRDPPTKITGLGKGNWVKSDERKREQIEKKRELKIEEKIVNAQRKRTNMRSLVTSEFGTGFKGIESQEVEQKLKNSKKKFQKKKKP